MKKIAVLLSATLLLCSCTKNTGENTIAETSAETTFTETTPAETNETTAPETEPVVTGMTIDEKSETVLQRAIRIAKNKFGDSYDEAVVFSDIDGDRFPEMITIDYCSTVYKYSDGYGWQTCFYGPEQCEMIRNTYYDNASDSCFFIDICAADVCEYVEYTEKLTYSENGEPIYEQHNNEVFFYPVVYWWDREEKGFFAEYISNGEYCLTHFPNGSTFDEYKAFVEESYSDYELVNSVDIASAAFEIADRYKTEKGSKFIFEGEFADKPALPTEKSMTQKPVLVQIGERKYTEDTSVVYLSKGEATEENFEKLACLPKLVSLCISDEDNPELTGIGKLTNLKKLTLVTPLTKPDELKKLTSLESLSIPAYEDIEFLRDMDSVRVLWLHYTLDKPDDYYAPLSDMDSLEYLPISDFERSITEEQKAWLDENCPDVILSFYKFG